MGGRAKAGFSGALISSLSDDFLPLPLPLPSLLPFSSSFSSISRLS
ncbi:MAG: hypothetical protein HC917_27710 [Richelia sp. SM2_1_7]|nr:hypothetical protein [Richelia sp. SM2_1_7]